MTRTAPDKTQITWSLCSFAELDGNTLYDVLALRSQVFVVEQDCVYADIDGLDRLPGSRHVLGYAGAALCAYGRSMAPTAASGEARSQAARIGRVVVRASERRRGLGDILLTMLLQDLKHRFPDQPVSLDAQLEAESLYARAGFARISEVFLEDGIEHVTMLRT